MNVAQVSPLRVGAVVCGVVAGLAGFFSIAVNGANFEGVTGTLLFYWFTMFVMMAEESK